MKKRTDEQKNKGTKEQKNKRTKINKIHPLALSRLGLFRAEFPAFPHVFSILNPQFSVSSHSLLSSPALLLYIPTSLLYPPVYTSYHGPRPIPVCCPRSHRRQYSPSPSILPTPLLYLRTKLTNTSNHPLQHPTNPARRPDNPPGLPSPPPPVIPPRSPRALVRHPRRH